MAGPGENIGSAHVDIHVNSAPGEAELAAFKAKVDRDFEELGRKKAEAQLNLKKTDFDKQIHEAKAQLDYFKMRRARATIGLAKKHFDEQIAAAEAELKALTGKKRTIQIDSGQVKAAHQAERLLAKEHALTERAALQTAKAERALTTERERAVTQTIKERSELAKLSAQYEKLRGKQIALEKSSRSVFSSRSIATAGKEARALERVAAEADYLKHRIEKLGGSVNDLDPAIQRNNTFLGRWLDRLGDTAVRIGPITTSIKGLGVGLGLLGPLIFQLGGGLTSLVGTIGSGLVGAATVGAGALSGLALSAAGVGFIIGPMVGEFKEVAAASESLHKAQLKYGKGSTEVATAQEKLNHQLRGVSPIAREGFEALGGIKDRWKELTKGARTDVFDAMGESIKTVQDILPAFANESVKTTAVAGKAWEGWMKSLRSPEAKSLLKGIMSDFRASIPGLADGFGSLIAMMGRLSAAGAHFLPSLSNGFADWANNLEKAVGGGDALEKDVGGLVNQMRDLGHLSQNTGSLLVHIFDASSDSGQGLVKSLDNVIQRWDKWTQTAEGERGLSEFFEDSADVTEDFMSTLSHLTNLLFQFSRATAPVADGLLKVATWIGDIVAAANDLVGVKEIFQGLGIALASLWVGSKAMAFATSIQTVTRSLYGLAAGTAAVEAAQAGGLGSMLFGRGKKATTVAETGTDAAKSARQIALFGGAAGAAEAATLGLTSSAGLMSLALAPAVLIPAGAVAGLVGLTLLLKEDRRTIEDVREEYRQAGKQISESLDESAQHVDQYIAAQHRNIKVNDAAAAARHRLIKLQRENAPANKVTAAVEALSAVERRQVANSHQMATVNRQQIQDQRALVSGAKQRIATAKEQINALQVQAKNERENREWALGLDPGQGRANPETYRELAQAKRDLATATRDVANAQREEAVTAIPYERQLKGLKPITQEAEDGLRKLAGTIGITATKKIGRFVDPKDVQRVTELGNKLTNLGRGAQVKQVAVKSQGADQTIAKLQRLQKQTNRVEASRATIKVGANDTQAQSKLKRLSALSQRVAGTKSTVHILARSENAEQAIQRLKANLTRLVTKQYKADLKAEDKSGATATNFHHRLQGVASKKYQARITAIDDASAKAKTAKSNADAAGRTKPKIDITATNAQALGAIGAVQSSLASLHDKTIYVNVVTRKSGGFAGGHSGMYYSNFATGGINDREIQRANEKAVTQRSGPSFRVNRPTMLVGEQAPSHPEYVIATNPAYQSDNERYLEDAAGEFGKEVVPAYKKGKGKSKGKKAAAPAGDNTAEMLRKRPRGQQSGSGKRTKSAVFPGEGKLYNEQPINAEKAAIDRIEENYSRQLDHEEREIRAGRLEAWSFGWFRDNQTSERNARQKLRNTLVPQAIEQIDQKEDKAVSYLTKGAGRPANVKALRRAYNKADRAYDAIDRDDYPDGAEGSKAYSKAKAQHQRSAAAAKRQLDTVERERKRAEKLKKLARVEKSKLRGEASAQDNPISEAIDDIQYINDVESGAVEAPYAESSENLIEESEEFKRAKADLVAAELAGSTPGEEAARARMIQITEREYNEAKGTPSAADDIDIGERLKQLREGGTNGDKPTLGEQTASYNEAREQLYQQFASNVTGLFPLTAGPGGAAIGGSGGAPTYAPGGLTALAAATPALSGASTSGADKGSIKIVNNFAAPPPDPHTWTRQQSFELGTL